MSRVHCGEIWFDRGGKVSGTTPSTYVILSFDDDVWTCARFWKCWCSRTRPWGGACIRKMATEDILNNMEYIGYLLHDHMPKELIP